MWFKIDNILLASLNTTPFSISFYGSSTGNLLGDLNCDFQTDLAAFFRKDVRVFIKRITGNRDLIMLEILNLYAASLLLDEILFEEIAL